MVASHAARERESTSAEATITIPTEPASAPMTRRALTTL
jgi:hypothetical protein